MSTTTERKVKVTFDADGNQLKKEVTELERVVNNAGKTAQSSGGLFSKFGKDVQQGIAMGFGISTVGLVTSAIGLIQQGIGMAVQVGMEFEASMSKVKAITNATGSEMNEMTEFARELGATTVQSASAAADAMAYMGMAGWDTTQIMAGLPAVLNLSIASGSEFGRVSDIVTDNLTAFGMEAEDAGYYADVLSYAMSNANVNMDNLGESLKYIAPVASGAGVAMEETVAMVSMLGDAGIKGSQAGTTLRSVILNLTGANKNATKILKELGIEIYDSGGKMRSMSDILRDLSSKLVDSSGNVDVATASMLVGKTAVSGFTAMLKQGGDKLESFSSALETSNGTAQRMADTMSDNLAGSWKSFTSAMEESAIQIYDSLEPALSGLVDGMASLVRTMNGTEEASNAYMLFGQQVSEATYNALQGVEALNNSMSSHMEVLNTVGKEVTPQFVADMLTNYQSLRDGVVANVTQMHDEELQGMITFGQERLGMTEEQLAELHRKMDTYRDEKIAKANELNDRAKEILAQYNGDTSTMTQAHYDELMAIQREQVALSIETLSSELDDKKGLLQAYTSETFKITKENANAVLENAQQTKDTLVNTAKQRMDEELIQAGRLKKIGAISDEAYQELIRKAQTNYDTIVADADEGFSNVVQKIQNSLGVEAVSSADKGMKAVNKAVQSENKKIQDNLDKNKVKVKVDPTQTIKDANSLWNRIWSIFKNPFSIKFNLFKPSQKSIQNMIPKSYSTSAMTEMFTGRALAYSTPSVTTMSRSGDTNITFKGNYSFNEKSDIDYFMAKTARMIERRY